MRRILGVLVMAVLMAACSGGEEKPAVSGGNTAAAGLAAGPAEVVKKMSGLLTPDDAGGIWEHLTLERRKRIDRVLRTTIQNGPEAYRPLLEDNSRTLFSGVFPTLLDADNPFTFASLGAPTVNGDVADIVAKYADGSERTFHLLKEGGAWKLEHVDPSESIPPTGPDALSIEGYKLK